MPRALPPLARPRALGYPAASEGGAAWLSGGGTIPALTFIDFGEAAKAMVAGLREEHPGLEIHVHDIRPAGPEGAGLRGAAESLGAAAHEGPAEAVASGDIVLSTVVAKAAVAVTEAAAPHLKPGPAPRRPELSRARHQAGGGGRRSKFRARANARP